MATLASSHPHGGSMPELSAAGQRKGMIKSPSALKLDATELPGAPLPLLQSFRRGSQDLHLRKRIRSFGDLHTVPDILDNSSCSAESSDDDAVTPGDTPMEEKSLFDKVLLNSWDQLNADGAFRYNVTSCVTKTLPGVFGFVAQLNEGRALSKRPTEFSCDKVKQPFDEKKFNFKKAAQSEALFEFRPTRTVSSSKFSTEGTASRNPHVVLINVSPIEYGHVLLVPRILDSLPQQISPELLQLALEMTAESDNPYFRCGYNSLGAYATINHLHFQAYYLIAPFPIERAETTRVRNERHPGGTVVSRLVNYPVRCLVFVAGKSLQELATEVGTACVRLQDANIPFNLMIVDRGARVFLIPQCYAERQAAGLVEERFLETQVNPACFEICGHLVMKRQCDYDALDEAFSMQLLAGCSLSEERFNDVIAMCVDQ